MKKTTVNNLEYLDISQEVNALQRPSTPFLSWLLGAGKTSPATSTEIKWRESELDGEDSSAQLEVENTKMQIQGVNGSVTTPKFSENLLLFQEH